VIRNLKGFSIADDPVISMAEADGKFSESLEVLEMFGCDHFFNEMQTVCSDIEYGGNYCGGLFRRNEARCLLLRVLVVEFK
jgi:hypothetical protein